MSAFALQPWRQIGNLTLSATVLPSEARSTMRRDMYVCICRILGGAVCEARTEVTAQLYVHAAFGVEISVQIQIQISEPRRGSTRCASQSGDWDMSGRSSTFFVSATDQLPEMDGNTHLGDIMGKIDPWPLTCTRSRHADAIALKSPEPTEP